MFSQPISHIRGLLLPSLRAGWGLFGWGLGSLVVIDVLDICLPLLLMRGIDALAAKEIPWQWALLYVGVSLLQGGLRVVWRLSLKTLETRVGFRERSAIVNAVVRQPLSIIQNTERGKVLALATSDVDAYSRIFESGIVVGIDAVIYLLGVPLVMLYLDPVVAGFVLAPLLIVPCMVRFGNRAVQRRYAAMQELFSRLAVRIQELVSGLRAIKISSREPELLQDVTQSALQHAEAVIAVNTTEARIALSVGAISAVALVSLVGFGGHAVVVGAMSVGTLVAFERYLRLMSWPLQATAFAGAIFEKGITSGDRLRAFCGKEALVAPSTDGQAHGGNCQFRLGITTALGEFHEVDLAPGAWVGVVGPVGAGKSTLLHNLGGVGGGEGVETVRWQVSGNFSAPSQGDFRLVEQRVFILNDTVRNNICFGREVNDEAEIWAALKIAEIDGFVSSLPEQLNSMIGERGVNISGGQRQRLALARAVLRAPEVLLLDDVTANLDMETEAKIVANLRKLAGCRVIWATQRIEPLQGMNYVVVLTGSGQVGECGPREVLAERPESWLSRLFKRAELVTAIGHYRNFDKGAL